MGTNVSKKGDLKRYVNKGNIASLGNQIPHSSKTSNIDIDKMQKRHRNC